MNPLLPGPPFQYLGGGQLGGPQNWRYRGRDVLVKSTDDGGSIASWPEPKDEGDTAYASATDPQGALANARVKIDLFELGDPWDSAADAVHEAMDDFVDSSNAVISRSSIARHIETFFGPFRQHKSSHRLRSNRIASFDSLPVPDRLRLIDEIIQVQLHAGMFDPRRMQASNPSHMVYEDLLEWAPPTSVPDSSIAERGKILDGHLYVPTPGSGRTKSWRPATSSEIRAYQRHHFACREVSSRLRSAHVLRTSRVHHGTLLASCVHDHGHTACRQALKDLEDEATSDLQRERVRDLKRLLESSPDSPLHQVLE